VPGGLSLLSELSEYFVPSGLCPPVGGITKVKVPNVGMAWMAGCVGSILAGGLLGYTRISGITLITRPSRSCPTRS
jgi:hypothetical protein